MNLEIALSTLCMLVLAGLITRFLAQRSSGDNHLVLVLALFSGTGVLLAMGSIEMAGPGHFDGPHGEQYASARK